jgi:hypothetical protein
MAANGTYLSEIRGMLFVIDEVDQIGLGVLYQRIISSRNMELGYLCPEGT